MSLVESGSIQWCQNESNSVIPTPLVVLAPYLQLGTYYLPQLLKLVLEVEALALSESNTVRACKSQRLVLSVKGYIDKLESVPVRARGLC